MQHIQPVDLAVIGAYFALMLGTGIAVRRANRSARDYFAGSNAIPWWMSGATMYMANFTAWTFSGAAGFAYATGWFALLYFATWPLAYLAGSALTAARWRRTRSITPVEFTRTRFNPATQQLFSWLLAANFVLTGGVQLAAVCTLLAPLLGVDMTVLILATGAVIVLYTFFGGIWAVSVTDTIQGLILLAVAAAVMPASVALAGGFGSLVHAVPALALAHEYHGVRYDVHWLVAIFLITAVGVAAGQGQRFYSVRDERAARRTGRFAAALFCTVPLVFGIPPLAARALWPDLSTDAFFAPYASGHPGDLVYVALCLRVLPAGVIGFFAAAMLAATMSTLSSVYNMVSSVVGKDIWHDLFRPGATDGEVLAAGRIATLGVGAAVVVLALAFVHSAFGIFNTMQLLFTVLNVPLVVPIAFGLLSRRPHPHSALAAILGGLIVGATGKFALDWGIGPQVYAQFAVTTAIMAISPAFSVRRPPHVATIAVLAFAVTAVFATLFLSARGPGAIAFADGVSIAAAAAMGLLVAFFARPFSRIDTATRERVDGFFRKLDTPVDVDREVAPQRELLTRLYAMLSVMSGIVAAILAATRMFVAGGEGGESTRFVLAGFFALVAMGFVMLRRQGMEEVKR